MLTAHRGQEAKSMPKLIDEKEISQRHRFDLKRAFSSLFCNIYSLIRTI
jgi:hypothetical protein